MIARYKYQSMLDEYKEFSRKFKLPEQRERIYYDLRGRVAPSQRTYKKWQVEQTNKAKERAEKKRRADMRAAQKAASQKAVAKEPSQSFKDIMESIQKNGVENNGVKALRSQLTATQIIEKLAGGDMTKGSCSSLAFSYIGNKNGLDVTDFRGGNSQYVFALNSNIQKFLGLDGVKGSITKVKKEIAGTVDIIKGLEYNKEYYLAVGGHAAIIRNTEHGAEYLELQSSTL